MRIQNDILLEQHTANTERMLALCSLRRKKSDVRKTTNTTERESQQYAKDIEKVQTENGI